MATNTDFNTLIGRIDTATTTLENNVSVLVQSTTDVTQSVTEVKGYATEAKDSATQSAQNATKANEQADKATTEATKAVNAVEQAKALAPFQEAPKDGGIYGRKNGIWTLVENSGSGGNTPIINAVKSVNNITPDVNGNVTINIPTPVEQVNADWNATSGKAQILNKPTLFNGDYNNLTNKPVLFSGSYNDLTNKPTIPTVPTKVSAFTNDSGYVTEAPKDSKQYVRQDGAWVISSGGGSVSTGFPTTENWAYNNKSVSKWQTANPFEPVELAKVGAYVDGEWYTRGELITTSGIKTLPSGRYWFTTTDFTNAPLKGKSGYINIILAPTKADPYNKVAEIFVLDLNKTVVAQYKLESNDSFSIVGATTNGSGSITEAPNDGKQYARQSSTWVEVQASSDVINLIKDNSVLNPIKIGSKWYQSGLRYSAEYPRGYNPTTMTGLSGYQIWVPFVALENATIDNLEIMCTGASASSTVQLGLYSSDANNDLAGAIFISEAISCATTGAKTAPCNIAIQKGKVYWLSSLVIGTPAFYRNFSDDLQSIKGGTSAGQPNVVGYAIANMTTMPITPPTNKVDRSGAVPRVAFSVL